MHTTSWHEVVQDILTWTHKHSIRRNMTKHQDFRLRRRKKSRYNVVSQKKIRCRIPDCDTTLYLFLRHDVVARGWSWFTSTLRLSTAKKNRWCSGPDELWIVDERQSHQTVFVICEMSCFTWWVWCFSLNSGTLVAVSIITLINNIQLHSHRWEIDTNLAVVQLMPKNDYEIQFQLLVYFDIILLE